MQADIIEVPLYILNKLLTLVQVGTMKTSVILAALKSCKLSLCSAIN